MANYLTYVHYIINTIYHSYIVILVQLVRLKTASVDWYNDIYVRIH